MNIPQAKTVTVANAGTPVKAAASSTPCCQLLFQAYPTNTGNVLIKDQAGNIIAWIGPNPAGNNGAGNPYPGGTFYQPAGAPASGNVFDLSYYQIDTEVSGEKCQVSWTVAV